MTTEFKYQIGDELKTVAIERAGDQFQVTVDGRVHSVTANRLGRAGLNLEINGQQWQAHVAHNGSRRYVALAGETWVFERVSQNQSRRKGPGVGTPAGLDSLAATMPGVVLQVLVTEGDRVERGQTLVLLEAMKMELRVTAPHAGQVRKLLCTAGQTVERGQILVEIEAE